VRRALLLTLLLTACVPQYQRVARRAFTGSCTVDAVELKPYTPRAWVTRREPHPRGPELQAVCERYAEYAGVNLALHVVEDHAPTPGWGDVGNPPWTEWRSPRVPVDIYIREAHVEAVARNDPVPAQHALRHEALHAKLWLETGDPDPEHTSPLWEGVIAGWTPPVSPPALSEAPP